MPQITTKWNTPGKILDANTSGQLPVPPADPIIDGTVPVTETGTSFSFPSASNPTKAGVPVDANLGVYLIKKLFKSFADIINGPASLSENEKYLLDLFLHSRAITIDKNSLLKTISQPGCEGIRFYLCAKPNINEAPGEPKQFLSLVTAGIDIDGKDLGYEFKSQTNTEVANDVFKVDTISLLSEFAAPPPAGVFAGEEANATYPLGSYGWGQI